MSLKNFKSRNGIDVDSYTIPNTSFQKALASNTTITVDTVALDSFVSCEYFITLKQGDKVRSSKVVMHTDGTNLDMTEYAITETGGAISGVAITATVSSSNALLRVTGTDAGTTTILIKGTRNINIPFIATAPDAPTIGTATEGTQSASVEFTAPVDNGGASITGYTVTSSPGNVTASGTSSPITVLGLSEETAYTFTVFATNSAGNSVNSSSSNQITTPGTPRMAYFGGGSADTGQVYKIDKINMVNDTSSTLTAELSSGPGLKPASLSNSPVAGYFGMGINHNGSMDKITFSNDSRSNISVSLPTPHYGDISTSVSNCGQKGYIWRRDDGSNNQNRPPSGRALNKFAFSTETNSVSAGFFDGNYPYYTREALSNHGSNAYVHLGYIQKFGYSTETISNFDNGFQSIAGFREYVLGISNSGTAGYYVGGGETANSNQIDKLSFTSDTKSALSSTLTAATSSAGTAARKGQHGYAHIFGTRGLDKFSFSTETASNVPDVLSNIPYITRNSALTSDGVL